MIKLTYESAQVSKMEELENPRDMFLQIFQMDFLDARGIKIRNQANIALNLPTTAQISSTKIKIKLMKRSFI